MTSHRTVGLGELFLLGPNLGSPWVLSLSDQGPRPSFELLWLAGEDMGDEVAPGVLFEDLWLDPSPSWLAGRGQGKTGRLSLRAVGPAQALYDIDSLGRPRSERDFRRLAPRVAKEILVGPQGRFYRLEVEPVQDVSVPTGDWILYDLVFGRQGCLHKNHHAVCFLSSFAEPFGFVHLTDLHLARRNDEMLAQVLRDAHHRGPGEIAASFRNFNDHVRRALARVNELAREGELSFAVITGDLVDFAHYGWDDEPRFDRVNWRTFVEILTGGGTEGDKGNDGLAVPCFTSLGNHDWRLHPYSPGLGSYAATFGLTKEETRSVYYEGFSLDDLGPAAEGRERVADGMELRLLGKTRRQRLARILNHKVSKWSLWAGHAVVGLGAGVVGMSLGWDWKESLPLFSGNAIIALVQILAKWLTGKVSDWLVDNPLHAGPAALASYFAWVSPYLEQVFFYGPHRFVLSDTGPDIFVGQVLEAKEWSRFKKMSLEDNILGGAPDSRAFLSDHSMEDWSQVDWIAAALERRDDAAGRTFVFLHAPPVNTDLGNSRLAAFRESKRRAQGLSPWVGREDANLTYGAVAQYLSQFLYLCLGTSEAEARSAGKTPDPGRPVDVVFAGHAHRNVEFRLGLDSPDVIRIYTDRYSDELDGISDGAERFRWWESHRPLVVQTAAAGPAGSQDPDPPYLRVVRIDEEGLVERFSVVGLGGEKGSASPSPS